MPFTDPYVTQALDIFIRRNEQLQQELANFNRHPGGLFVSERRAEHARTAFLRAAQERDTSPQDFALRLLARTPDELEQLREARRRKDADYSPVNDPNSIARLRSAFFSSPGTTA